MIPKKADTHLRNIRLNPSFKELRKAHSRLQAQINTISDITILFFKVFLKNIVTC